MTGRERFAAALRRQPVTGHVPHFELVFFLTMEVLGKVHPCHRNYAQWNQMTTREQELQLQDMAACYIDIARRYDHDAIFVHPNPVQFDATKRLLEIIRERTGTDYFIMTHGDSTPAIPDGEGMMDFSVKMYEDPEAINSQTRKDTEQALGFAQKLAGTGLLDGFALCSDYCFNQNPFYTEAMFDLLVVPHLKALIDGYRAMGYYSIKHTDGNIMPILEQLVACGPDALHSLDPQGGVDLKAVKAQYGGRVCLIGNVNCGLLQTGTEAEAEADVLRALRDGMPGGGYIFSTSNCVYTGLPLERYHLMHRLWRQHGVYD